MNNTPKVYDENKIAFIICSNDELLLGEALNYLQLLDVPEGMETELFVINDAKSMLLGMEEGIASTDAKYKVFMHQDVLILNRNFIADIIDIFHSDTKIGLIGMVGSPKMPPDGMMWHNERVGNCYGFSRMGSNYEKPGSVYTDVVAVDGLLMATAYDIPLRKDLFDGWDFYDVSTSFEYKRAGYRVVVPVQEKPWCLHDDGMVLSMWNYDKYRHVAMEEYKEFIPEMKKEEK